MRFEFRYESLLAYRRYQKEKAEVALAKARQKLRQDIELLNEHQNNIIITNKEFADNLKNKTDSGTIWNHSNYFVELFF